MIRSHVSLTADDVIALLKRTQLPTVVIEGDLDALIFRHFEEANSDNGLSVLPVGGRSCLLEVFDRKDEIDNDRIVFFADRDSWVYSQIPMRYHSESIIFTVGYSIENDAYIDGDLEKYLTAGERAAFFADLSKFLDWYSLALSRMLSGTGASISLNPHHVLGPEHPALVLLAAGEAFPTALRGRLESDYRRLVRGKSLLKLLLLQLGKSSRTARHSAETLMEVSATGNGALIQNAFVSIKAALGVP